MTRIAVVGMACRYPEAASPDELWNNAVAGRRAFRRLPDERMSLDDYWSPDPSAPDRFYARNAAVLEGYTFDRISYKVAGSTFRSTDMTHWLALDTAAQALADAGYPGAVGLPNERTSVVVGNTLTGDMTRANTMRLRWPYVRRTVAAALRVDGWTDERIHTFLRDLEVSYKRPFPEIDEDTLAGGLSNTIAGRICNHFDLKGGGYTVDGACSSSLLSVITACRSLVDGSVEVAVAGGVDLSIDPFEIIGFAKAGALATGEMRVYDRGGNGFWPGEGCGMVVLMREEDAIAEGRRVYTTVAGWGISSDGKGGITRPEAAGYQLALDRAYAQAGFGVESVALFEGHGTGTRVGDTTELTALSRARAAAGSRDRAAIGSIKGMIGHTKAAAGIAGLIKAAMATHHEVLPPTIGCVDPHDLLTADDATLRALRKAEPWPADQPLRVGVTAMGFGGINTHIVLERSEPEHRRVHGRDSHDLASSIQDVELLLIDADSTDDLRARVQELVDFVPGIAFAQLADLAATLHARLDTRPFRAAAVVSSPADAERQLTALRDALDRGEVGYFTADGRGGLGLTDGTGRIGFLFPGQGSGRGTSGGALRRRFAEVDEVYAAAALPTSGDMVATAVAQPRIIAGSLAGLRALALVGIEADVAVGHSLGELAALHWSDTMDAETVLRIASVRGATMAEHSSSGTMASLAASAEVVIDIIAGLPVVVAGYNGPRQTVVSGAVDAVAEACRRAGQAGIEYVALSVSHAFHSELVAPAAAVFGERLAAESFRPPRRRVVSTVTGEALAPDVDIAALLHRQIVDPVLFAPALQAAVKDVDLLVEVGPGRVLSGLAEGLTDIPVRALDTDAESLAGLLGVVAAAFVVGACEVGDVLFRTRLIKPLRIGQTFSYLTSPCETAPRLAPAEDSDPEPLTTPNGTAGPAAAPDGTSIIDVLRRVTATRAELPEDLVHDDSRLLDDLHLSSITVGQVVNQAAAQLGLSPSQTPTNVATATLRELAESLATIASTARPTDTGPVTIDGVGPWARAWRLDLDEAGPVEPTAPGTDGTWQVFAPTGQPGVDELRDALGHAGVGGGVLVRLPDNCSREHLALALDGAKAALVQPPGSRFVLVQHGRGASGIAKTLRLEAPHIVVTIIDTPPSADLVARVVAETAATTSFTETRYDATGTRRVPVLRPLPIRPVGPVPALTDTDVLLVTGGGKGITAECAIAMAIDSGARLALIGRADPAADAELAGNLDRMAALGLTVEYARADVTDADQVRVAVERLTGVLGPVTALLHGAGRNEPAALTAVRFDDFERTFAPKIDGLRTVLDAVVPGDLKLLVTLGSIIGIAGLRGEAHYATANDWLAYQTADVARTHPDCRSICVAWSVWSGVGMGERLAVVETLAREGITPVTPEQGIEILRTLLADPGTPELVLVSGRTGIIDTVRYHRPELPLLRFLERPLVDYPGTELVVEVTLDAVTDHYLDDHRLDGNLLLPAVLGMEGMAQVGRAVTGRTETPVFENAEFLRPIIVPPGGRTTIRIAALVTDDDTVRVVIRSEETGFAADHFRARLVYDGRPCPDGAPDQVGPEVPAVELVPETDLYDGETMFQGDRFQRVERYHRAAARNVDADLSGRTVRWFSDFMPPDLLLGDPGVRDALMHGNQVCVPDATLLPVGVERIHPAGARMADAGRLRYCAVERSSDGDSYLYDIALRDDVTGTVIERWEGLRLRAVRRRDGRGPWVPALLGPYLERTLNTLFGADVAVAVTPTGGPAAGRTDTVVTRRAQTALAATHVLGYPVDIRYRPDGRPEIDGDRTIIAAHGAGVTLCVAGTGRVGCDVEPIVDRDPDTWTGLLGTRMDLVRLLIETTGEDLPTAATRVWTAVECVQKAGLPVTAPITLEPGGRDGWALFSVAGTRIGTVVTTLRGSTDPVAFAVLAEGAR